MRRSKTKLEAMQEAKFTRDVIRSEVMKALRSMPGLPVELQMLVETDAVVESRFEKSIRAYAKESRRAA